MPPYRNQTNPGQHGILEILRWKIGLPPYEKPVIPHAPDQPAAWQKILPEQITEPPEAGWRILWLGHASFLLQGSAVSLLIDPVFSKTCAPWGLPFLHRLVPTPCTLAELPTITAVLLTHSHYDHLDLATLRQLGHHIPLFVPAGHQKWLHHRGFHRVTEVPWYESQPLAPGLTLTATPAHHFTARTLLDRDRAHWGGWHLQGSGCTLWHAGDSAYAPHFSEISARLGPIDLGMIPIGAYQPRHLMQYYHMNPEEAVQTFIDAQCRSAIAMHWGTFRLTDEPLGEPPLRLRQALAEKNIPPHLFQAGNIGQIWHLTPSKLASPSAKPLDI